MLRKDEVEAEEESLRRVIRGLSDDQRSEFYRHAGKAVKDPDTYAALNWLFIVGLHHFYLGRWGRGMVDIVALLVAIGCFVSGYVWTGAGLLLVVWSCEVWALFRSQTIVQDWNNRLYRSLLHRQKQP